MSIDKNIILSRTSGSGNSISQIFLCNEIVDIKETATSPLYFDVPVYKTDGATYQYYTQTTDGISASLNNIKTFTFNFSANTNSISGTTKMKHDIYRIDNDVYNAYFSQAGTTGIVSTTPSSAITFSPSTAVTSNISNVSVDMFNALSQPFYTAFEDVSGTTFLIGSSHTFTLPQKVKPTGLYTQDLFIDKAQYFIDSTFLFEQPIDQTIGDVEMFSGNQIVQLYDMPYSSSTFVQTSNRTHTITGGTFSGTTISGATFTYFVPPKKPDIFVLNDRPTVEGVLNTFCPVFSFKNTEDSDYYKVQVNYNTGDTSFTGETTSFKFQAQIGDANYIRTVAAAITPNSKFLYRIGSTKEIINLFSVKQNITTWSEYAYAESSNDGTFDLSGHVWFNQIGGAPIVGAIITLTVQATNSAVDLGSDTIHNSNITSNVINPLGGGIGSTILKPSNNPGGDFTFGKINGGQYIITVQHPTDPNNFPTQTINIFISSDTDINVIFSLLWGSTNISFSDPYTFL